jgi:metallophosphoesterase (TIGR03767 family)
MSTTRRDLLRASAAAGAAFAWAGNIDPLARAAGMASAHARRVHRRGTTLEHTILRGHVLNGGGYRRLTHGQGEPHLVRDDLGIRPQKGRAKRRRGLLSLVQFTDTHIVDAQSPARAEYMDRYNDGVASALVFSAAYRPHEMLTAQVTDSLVRAVNRVGRGPVTRRRFDFAITTGDTVDNCQRNELRWLIDTLDGERVRPDSGDHSRWEGVSDETAANYDPHYWHPDGTPDGKTDDVARSTYGFPTIPGLLDEARKPFRAAGLEMPWLAAYGNHDGLVQGNFPQSFHLGALSTGSVKITALPAGISPQDVAALDPVALAGLLTGPVRVVSADPARKVIDRKETVAEYFKTSGTPRGHGFRPKHLRDGTAYYGFHRGIVKGLVLDTVNPNGYSEGSLDPDQWAWLQNQLMKHSRHYLDEAGEIQANRHGRDRLIVLFSHHTITTMSNPLVADDDPRPRTLGDEVEALLLRFPNVVLWVNGHTHVNEVVAHPRAHGSRAKGGFWEVNTASHIDFPQQARIVEVADNRDGTLSVFGTIVDSAADLHPAAHPRGPAGLAAMSRQLAANDWQERPAAPAAPGTPDGRRGLLQDRNVELVVPAPFEIRHHA